MKIVCMGVLAALLFPAVLHAEEETRPKTRNTSDANVTGHVQDASTGKHIPYITVSLKGTTIGTVTDATGHYFLKNLPSGDFVLVASSVGYGTEEIAVKLEKDKTQEVNFLLTEQVVNMEQVVVSSNRSETSRKTTSSIVNVLSPKLFESTGSSSLSESIGFQSGLRLENNCSNCEVVQLRINGLEGDYSQILLDSRPIFSSLAGVYGLEQLPASMIDRVEVIRGGGSALFGANAIGGVVNIITKEPQRNSLSVGNTTGFFSGKDLDVNTSFNGSFVSDDNRAGVYLFGMVRDRDPYDRNGDGFSELPKLESETAGFRGYYKTGLYSKLTAEYHHIREFRRGGDLMDRPPHEANIAEQLRHKIDGGGLSFDTRSRNQHHSMSLYASAQRISRDSYFGTDMNPDAYGRTLDKTFVAGGQYAASIDRLLFAPSTLTIGAELTHNDLHDQMLGYQRDLEQHTNIIGAYLQNEWRHERFSVLVGARLDKHNLMKNAVFSPRINARYSPNDHIGLRASYSSGYRAPQTYNEDLHVNAVGGAVSIIELDPNLKPEYSHSFSASADLYESFGKFQANLLVEGFYTVLNDVFALVQQGEDAHGNQLLLRTNASGATVRGVNLEARMGLPGVVELQMGYTFQRSRYKDPFKWSEDASVAPQRKMFRSPDQYGYLTANVTVTPALRASLFGNYTGQMLVQHNKGYVEHDSETLTPRFWDMGMRLAYTLKLTKSIHLELSGGVKNVFDSFQKDIDLGSMRDAKYIYGPSIPRTWFLGVKFAL